MNRFALTAPLKAGLWYAKATREPSNFPDVFCLGPWPTLEDGVEELNEGVGPFAAGSRTALAGPAVVEFGRLIPFEPGEAVSAHIDGLVIALRNAARICGEPGRAWAATLDKVANIDAKAPELVDAVALVVAGWMARHECFPHFGTVVDVVAYHCPTRTKWVPVDPWESQPPPVFGGEPLPTPPEYQFKRCEFRRTMDMKQCNRRGDHDGEHKFTCCQRFNNDACSCDLDEGHAGDHEEIPF